LVPKKKKEGRGGSCRPMGLLAVPAEKKKKRRREKISMVREAQFFRTKHAHKEKGGERGKIKNTDEGRGKERGSGHLEKKEWERPNPSEYSQNKKRGGKPDFAIKFLCQLLVGLKKGERRQREPGIIECKKKEASSLYRCLAPSIRGHRRKAVRRCCMGKKGEKQFPAGEKKKRGERGTPKVRGNGKNMISGLQRKKTGGDILRVKYCLTPRREERFTKGE